MARPAMRVATGFAPKAAAVFVAAMATLFAVRGDAQVSSSDPSQTFAGTVSDLRRSAGVPLVLSLPCQGQRRDDRITLSCTIRYDSPIEVTSARITEQPGGRNWLERRGIKLFTPLEGGQDDTAFFVLVDAANKARAKTIQRAARDIGQVFFNIGSQQRVAVASFGNELTVLEDFTNDGNAIIAAFNRIQPAGGNSELYKHTVDAIGRLGAITAGRRVLIVVSDGETRDKETTVDQVLEAAKRAQVRIVTVGYAERNVTQDINRLQNLERLTLQRRDQYRPPVQTRALPEDFTKTILTRFGFRVQIEAESPTRDVPKSVDVTINHPENRTTTFRVALAAGQPGQPPVTPDQTPEEMARSQDASILGTIQNYVEQTYNQVYSWAIENPWLAGGVGVGILALLVGVVLAIVSLRRSRPAVAPVAAPTPPPYQPAPRPPYEPPLATAPPPPPPSPPVQPDTAARSATTLERADDGGRDAVTVFRAPQREPEAPVIAWLEFNGKPGRYAVRKSYITVGRQTDNDAVTDPADATVSRYHAVVTINTDGRFTITNKSKETRANPNPIYINGEERDHAELVDGDMVKLGTGTYGFIFREARGDS